MKNTIALIFPPDLSRLSSFLYGREIYRLQLKSQIIENEKYIIIFPDNIEGISISFIKGLLGTYIEKYGKNEIFDIFTFKSIHKNVINQIKENIIF